MNINTDLLDITQNRISSNQTNRNPEFKASKNGFSDALNEVLKKDSKGSYNNLEPKKTIQEELNSATIVNLNKLSENPKIIDLVDKFKNALNKVKDKESLNDLLTDIHAVLNESLSELENLDLSNNIELDSDSIETILDSILDILNGFTANAVLSDTSNLLEGNMDLSIELVDNSEFSLFDSALDIDNALGGENSEALNNSLDSLFQRILESTTQNPNYTLSNSANGEDIISKLTALMSSGEVDDKVDDLSLKKEDILINPNNLDISSAQSTTLNKTDFLYGKSAELHPIAKQVLSNIQAQLSSINLDNKTIELRLKLFPSKLGGISVVLDKIGDSISIKLLSDNPEVRNILLDSVNGLKFDLNKTNKGSVNIDVTGEPSQHRQNSNKENDNDKYNTNNYIDEAVTKVYAESRLTNKILDIKI